MLKKFYVRSGRLERIVMAETPQKAAEKALDACKGETVDNFLYVSEQGFRGPTEDEPGFDTEFPPGFSIPLSKVANVEGEDEGCEF